MSTLIGDDEMDNLIERYMDEETIRMVCFFLKNKFDPEGPCCPHCTRLKLCERDALKLINALGYIPWLAGKDLKHLTEKSHGHQRCENCEI